MRYTLSIDQPRALEWGLNLPEAHVFAFCYSVPSWADKVVIGGEVYYFASRNKAVEEIQLVTDKPDTIYRHYKALARKGLIRWKKIDGKDCIQLTDKAKDWNTRLGNISEHSENYPNGLGNISESNSENFPTNKNTSIDKNTSNKRERPRKFAKPSLLDITTYMTDRGAAVRTASVEAEKFFDHFQSNGWKVGGRSPMKDWKAAVRQWLRRIGDFAPNGKHTPPAPRPATLTPDPYEFPDLNEDEVNRMKSEMKQLQERFNQ